MEISDLLGKIAEKCKLMPEIKAAFAFGSVVTPYFNSDSDVDLALICSPELGVEQILNLKLELEELSDRSVDLISINSNLSAILGNEIARSGKLLFSKDEALSDNFIIKAPQYYEDLMYTRKQIEDSYIDSNRHD